MYERSWYACAEELFLLQLWFIETVLKNSHTIAGVLLYNISVVLLGVILLILDVNACNF